MQQTIDYLAPVNCDWQTLTDLPPLVPLQPSIRSFLSALSQRLLNEADCKTHPELVALGFWLREANLNKMLSKQPRQPDLLRKALGLVVHFTPANVDTMFVYSWVCALLMGNNNIVRVASQASKLQSALFAQLNHLFCQPEYVEIARRNLFIQYPKTSQLSAELCQQAHARVIWGGDTSVNAIRALPCPPRCRDISFADRYSATLIDGDQLNETNVQSLAELLHRDTQPYQQQACSSPRVVFWLGSTEYQRALWQKTDLLFQATPLAIQQHNQQFATTQVMQSTGNADKPLWQQAIWVLPVHQLNAGLLDWHNGQGLFLLNTLTSLSELAGQVDSKLQSLSYWGVDKAALFKLLAEPSITGIDRIVPLGQALDFNPVWDGVDLFGQLSRSLILN